MYFVGGGKATLKMPPHNSIELMIKLKFDSSEKISGSFLEFCSENHKVKIAGNNKDNITFDVYNDDEKILSDIVGIKIKDECKWHIKIGNNHLNIYIDNELIAEYTGSLLAGEPITNINIISPFNYTYSYFNIYWFLVSSEKIPFTASIKTITPEVETDWEKDGNQYQASEAGKTMKLKMPESYSPPQGKSIFASAPFLKNVTGGGYVNIINIHTDNMDIDKTITENEKTFGYYDDGEVVFTTKE